jgi:hypothetical protein
VCDNQNQECVGSARISGSTEILDCTPLTCDDVACGKHDDGCGGTLDCGECCVPKDVCNPGDCGVIFDGCSGNIDCGPCCEPLSCAQLVIPCGIATDNCGNEIDCGPCPPETTPAPPACFGEGERCVNDGQCCAGLCRGRDCRDRGTKLCQAACAV